jgi:hypothetical protein
VRVAALTSPESPPSIYFAVAALNLATSSVGTRPRSFTSMPWALAYSRTSVVFAVLAGPLRPRGPPRSPIGREWSVGPFANPAARRGSAEPPSSGRSQDGQPEFGYF